MDEEELDSLDDFDDFENLNFTFSINFIVPFWGYEAFPFIDKMIADLDLYVLNPQDDTDLDNPRKYEPGYFQKQWSKQNKKSL